MPTRHSEDDRRQLNKLIIVAQAILERYSRIAEEYDSVRLFNEALSENLNDLIGELSLWANRLSERLERIERLMVLDKTGLNPRETAVIKQNISDDLLDQQLREDLVQAQNELKIYQDNINRTNIRIAKQGQSTISQENDLMDWQIQLDKLQAKIKHMREALKPYGTELNK